MPIAVSRSLWTDVTALDAATTAWVAAVVAAGGTVSAGRQNTVNTLILSLKAAGIFAKLDRLWLYAAENTQSALIDVVNLGVTSLFSTPTFTADRGYAGNGTTTWLITDFNATVGTNKFLLDDAHWGHWNNTNDVSGQGYSGNDNTASASFQAFAGQLYLRVNDNAGPIAGTNPTGFILGSRQNATGSSTYRNGALLENITTASVSLQNALFQVLHLPIAGGSPTQAAAYSLGGGLTATEVGDYYTALRTYMTSVGVP